MLGIPLGLAYANAGEWLIHKYVLHGLGKKRSSFWSFHFHEHHKNSRRNGYLDPDYQRPPLGDHAQGRELGGLIALGVLHAPLLPVAPLFTLTVWGSAAYYYRVHKRSHRDPAWAREHLPWHYDHHLGPDQDCNWCVSHPWFDRVMGTRRPYVGTERETADLERREQREAA